VLNPELKEIIYQTKKVIKPRIAFRQHKRIGSFEKAEVKLNTTWDNKRILLPNGFTRQLKNIEEYENLKN
jgi:hypothetical protein